MSASSNLAKINYSIAMFGYDEPLPATVINFV